MDNAVLKILGTLSILVTLFILVIFNVNYQTSTLYRQNRSLNEEKDSLEGRLERRNQETGTDITNKIQDRLRNGTLEPVNPSTTTSIVQIPPSVATVTQNPKTTQESSLPVQSGQPGGLVIR